jgi:hypothetical protein
MIPHSSLDRCALPTWQRLSAHEPLGIGFSPNLFLRSPCLSFSFASHSVSCLLRWTNDRELSSVHAFVRKLMMDVCSEKLPFHPVELCCSLSQQESVPVHHQIARKGYSCCHSGCHSHSHHCWVQTPPTRNVGTPLTTSCPGSFSPL